MAFDVEKFLQLNAQASAANVALNREVAKNNNLQVQEIILNKAALVELGGLDPTVIALKALEVANTNPQSVETQQ